MHGNIFIKNYMRKINKLIHYNAIGDSLLLPYEFLNKKLIKKRFNYYGLKQSLIFKYGLTSDDNDHLIITAKALLETNSVEEFKKSLSNKLKLWLFSLPIGIGATTLKSIIKLLLGFKNSGIKSEGNGPLMRVPVIALNFAHDSTLRNSYIKASTEITHKSPQSLSASIGVGNFITYLSNNGKIPKKEELNTILKSIEEPIWEKYCELLIKNIDLNLDDFIRVIECQNGVTGYIMHTAIFSIYTLYHEQHPFEQIILAGGDTDTIGALVGSYLSLIEREQLSENNYFLKINNINKNFWLKIFIKNLILIPVVLAHVIMRIITTILSYLLK